MARDVLREVQTAKNTVRNFNIELFRIITMILIVAHHYIVNSGLMEVMSAEVLSAKSVFLYLFGAWGKALSSGFDR